MMKPGSPEYENLTTETFWLLMGYYNDQGISPDVFKLNRMADLAVRAHIEGRSIK